MSHLMSPRDSSGSVISTGRSGSRHQIKRSLSELTSPVKLGRHHRKDRHHHHSSHSHHNHSDNHNDEKVPQSAVVPPSNSNTAYLQNAVIQSYRGGSMDIPRSEGVTPLMSPIPSRRASVMLQREEEARLASALMAGQPLPKLQTEETLLEEQEKATLMADGLRHSLADLGRFSSLTSRQLDETYYAVLEKMSTLQNTIAALKDLAENSHGICQSFEKDSKEIENDITSQLVALGQFEDQQRSIESLQTRIQDGKAKVKNLSERVDVVLERVEGWERAGKEWQEKTRRRLKAIWIAISVLVLVFILLSVGAQYVPQDLDFNSMESPKPTRLAESVLGSRNVSATGMPAERFNKDGLVLEKKSADDGQRLRVFDEL